MLFDLCQGEPSTDTDAEHTGERVSVGGLDEAEEAQRGVTDEELEAGGAEDDADLVKTPPEEEED